MWGYFMIKYNCVICNNSYYRFIKHLKNEHNISDKEYYDTYIKTEDEGICLVCGKPTKYISFSRGYQKHCKSCGSTLGQLKRYKNSEERKKNRERVKQHWKNPIIKNKLSNSCKKRFENLEERQRISTAVKNSKIFQAKIHSEEYSKKMHEILIERYKDENNRKKMSESCKKSLVFQNSRKNKEFRERHSEIMYERIKNGKFMVKYEYNNETFMSLPELAFYIWLKQHKVEFEYQCKPLFYEKNGIFKKYIPDFKVKGRYVEIKGPFFIKDNHLWDPFEKRFNIEKEQCMIDHDVYIMTKDKYNIFVDWLKKKYGNEFILNHRK